MSGDDWADDDWVEGERELAPPQSLSIGFLALVPMLAAYELAREAAGGGLRNTSELLLGRALTIAGPHADPVRMALLAAVALGCLVFARRSGWRIARSLMRVGVEGLVGGMLLGPVLLMLVTFLGDRVSEVALPAGLPADVPDLTRAALVFGSGAWEELCFRLGVYSMVFVLAKRTAGFLGAADGMGATIGDGVALLVSSLVFAAVHLDAFVGVLGAGGEPFHSGLFAWRAFAGVCLGVLYRWRGLGVAAWTHGLFNVGLILGAGPAFFV